MKKESGRAPDYDMYNTGHTRRHGISHGMTLNSKTIPSVCPRRVHMSLLVYDPSWALPLRMHVRSVNVLSEYMSPPWVCPSTRMSPPCVFLVYVPPYACSFRVYVASMRMFLRMIVVGIRTSRSTSWCGMWMECTGSRLRPRQFGRWGTVHLYVNSSYRVDMWTAGNEHVVICNNPILALFSNSPAHSIVVTGSYMDTAQ